MITKEKERKSIDQSKKDFDKLRSQHSFSADDQEHLALDLTDLIGWYRINADIELKTLIERMILFGESKQWSMVGIKIAFEHAKVAQPRTPGTSQGR